LFSTNPSIFKHAFGIAVDGFCLTFPQITATKSQDLAGTIEDIGSNIQRMKKMA
jgi:hypothetical protein